MALSVRECHGSVLGAKPVLQATALEPFRRVTIPPVRREFSAGGVLVRRLRGRWVFAAIRPAGKPPGVWALPKGARRQRREAGRDGAARGGGGDGRAWPSALEARRRALRLYV